MLRSGSHERHHRTPDFSSRMAPGPKRFFPQSRVVRRRRASPLHFRTFAKYSMNARKEIREPSPTLASSPPSISIFDHFPASLSRRWTGRSPRLIPARGTSPCRAPNLPKHDRECVALHFGLALARACTHKSARVDAGVSDVRFTLRSRHHRSARACPLWAIFGFMQRSKTSALSDHPFGAYVMPGWRACMLYNAPTAT
jgi:hypothetical protein